MHKLVVTVPVFLLLILSCRGLVQDEPLQGKWELLLQNAGISSMHTTVIYYNKVLMFDRLDWGSNITRTAPPCNNVSPPLLLNSTCWAHSVEYDIATNKIRPLHLLTDTWCSSGALSSNGTLVQTGGTGESKDSISYYTSCSDSNCNWVKSSTQNLSAARWYASDQILPDNRVIVVGGRSQYNYEFVPKYSPGETVFDLPFLEQTQTDKFEENNLYPFLHLSSDGNLFIFANRDSILLDYKQNKIVRTFPTIPGGVRTYPASGSSVMLPLNSADNFQRVEIVVCGGATMGAFTRAVQNKIYVEALKSCGRMEITAKNPVWQMEDMPGPRVMNDMLILPTGEILIINGARNGTSGFQTARMPVLNPWLYRSAEPAGGRFTVLAPSNISRMYHSTANLLPDGRVLLAGSNPNLAYDFSDSVYSKTELRVEAYSPYYLDSLYDPGRPKITYIKPWAVIHYGSEFLVNFTVYALSSDVRFMAYSPPFTTHSVSMNQRMLSLAATPITNNGAISYSVFLTAPPSPVAAPSGYYLLSAVNGGVPSQSRWIRFV